MLTILDRSAVVLLAIALTSGACATVCPQPSSPHARVSDLEPGEYAITLRATGGTEAGRMVKGFLTLVRTESEHWGGSTLIGFAEIDLDAVGASVRQSEGPPLSSRDPNAPGVLVQRVDWSHSYPAGTPVLLLGTGTNENPVIDTDHAGNQIVRVSTDGSGIGLWVHETSSQGFSGKWGPWGILFNGDGHFCASRIQE